MNFKDVILNLRKERNLNQVELAEKLGVSKSSVAMWETGDRLPSPEMFETIADFFNVDIDYLYGRSDVKSKVQYDNDGKPHYYLNDDAAKAAQFLYENPEYKVLFDASRKVKKEDITFVKEMMDRMRGKDDQ